MQFMYYLPRYKIKTKSKFSSYIISLFLDFSMHYLSGGLYSEIVVVGGKDTPPPSVLSKTVI